MKAFDSIPEPFAIRHSNGLRGKHPLVAISKVGMLDGYTVCLN